MQFVKFLLISILTFFFSFLCISQNTYYVSTTGNNSNDGKSIETSWKTIAFAASAPSGVSPDAKVYLKVEANYNY